MIDFSFWAWLGTFYLFFMTWQDYANKMKIDDRANWYMLGMTSAVAIMCKVNLWQLVIMVILFETMFWLTHKWNILGKGDTSAFRWIFYGFGAINLTYLITCLIVFMLVITAYHISKKYILKINQPTPFFGAICIIFISTNLLVGLY